MIVEGLKKYCENCPKADLYVESDVFYANGEAAYILHALHCNHEEICKQTRKELIKELKEKWGIEDESI